MRSLLANLLLAIFVTGAFFSLSILVWFLWRAWLCWMLGRAEDERPRYEPESYVGGIDLASGPDRVVVMDHRRI